MHYNKHAKSYVDNFNSLLDKSDAARTSGDFKTYTELTRLLKFNGGGHINHEFFWQSLSPKSEKGGKLPISTSNLSKLVQDEWGSYENLIKYFNTESAKIMGSGWAWLIFNNTTKKLEYRTTAIHDVV